MGCAVLPAAAADPVVPPGEDPGGVALALIGPGIDYRSPKIAPRLARDGEGEPIAWDFVDDDRTPFGGEGDGSGAAGTAIAEAMVASYTHGRLVPLRVATGNPGALARAIAFAVGTPAKIVAIAMPLETPAEQEVIRQASARFSDHLFVVAGPTLARADTPSPAAPDADAKVGTLLNIGNVLVVTGAPDVEGRSAAAVSKAVDLIVVSRGSSMFGGAPGAPPRNALEAVALAAASAACQGHGGEPLRGSAAKAATFDASRPLEGGGGLRVLDPLCFYGGRRM
ncbi:MAG: hypothetical protein AB7E80_14850 [Hyphomicrobiaceae bacterium]